MRINDSKLAKLVCLWTKKTENELVRNVEGWEF